MRDLLDVIQNLKNGEIKKLVDARLKEFQKMGENEPNEIFKELCFCIMTANCSAEMCIRVQNEVGDEFLTIPENQLAKRLKEVKYRFYNKRANYINEARKFIEKIKERINSSNSEEDCRDWLVENIKGLGYKEASHFLRNIGFKNLAIIDFHIIDLMVKHNLINERPKLLSKKKYIEIEGILKEIAKELNLYLGELDLYLWYMETGKVLK